MNSRSELTMSYKTIIGDFISWIFGIIAAAIGIINIFWGNDIGFGIFIFLLAFVFFPPVMQLLKKRTGFSISGILKIILACFIVWSAAGVGELSDKIDLMLESLK